VSVEAELEGLNRRIADAERRANENAMESVELNEEMGERRVQLLFTVASAAAVAVGLVADGDASPTAKLWAAAGAAITVGLLGLLTVRRLARRNDATTDLVNRLHNVRWQATEENSELRNLFVRDPYANVPPREQAWVPTKGGLVDIAGCATAAFIGAAVLCAGLAVEAGGAVLFGFAVAIGAWLAFWRHGRGPCLGHVSVRRGGSEVRYLRDFGDSKDSQIATFPRW
jgi:hypothetical protein